MMSPKKKYRVFTIRMSEKEYNFALRFCIIGLGVAGALVAACIFHEMSIARLSAGVVVPEFLRAMGEAGADAFSDY